MKHRRRFVPGRACLKGARRLAGAVGPAAQFLFSAPSQAADRRQLEIDRGADWLEKS